MSLPRDISGDELAQRLARLGYECTRQTGSHVRLTTDRGGQHHLTIPRHGSLRLGTLAAVLIADESIPDEKSQRTRSSIVEDLPDPGPAISRTCDSGACAAANCTAWVSWTCSGLSDTAV